MNTAQFDEDQSGNRDLASVVRRMTDYGPDYHEPAREQRKRRDSLLTRIWRGMCRSAGLAFFLLLVALIAWFVMLPWFITRQIYGYFWILPALVIPLVSWGMFVVMQLGHQDQES